MAEDSRLFQEKYLSISNNDSGMKKIGHLYEDVSDKVIDFRGKELLYDEPLVPFVLQNCKNITLKNFSIDFTVPFFLQGEVVAIDQENGTMDLKILETCIYTVKGDKLYFRGKKPGLKWKNKGSVPSPSTKDMTWEQNFEWNMWFRKDGSTPYGESGYHLLETYTCEEIAPGIVRFYEAMDRFPEVGWHLVIKGKKEKNRRWPAIFIENCENITLENVTVHTSSGMALIAQRTDTVTLNRYQVKLKEGTGRICTSTADGTHFSGCKGTITLRDSFFENMLDDALNVHGIFVIGEEVLDDGSVLCRYGHSQQVGVPFAGPGDVLRAYEASSFKEQSRHVVKAIETYNQTYFRIEFEEALEKLPAGETVFDNMTWQPEVLISGCTVRNNRARSLLVQTEKKVIIENNIFEGPSMNCLQFSGDTDFWYESGYVNDVTVRNNTFHYVRDYLVKAYIEVNSDVKYHHNITVCDNIIYSTHSKMMDLYAVSNLQFIGNTIHLMGNELDDQSYKQQNCEAVLIKDNRII